jgi:hypothetical protein
MLTCPKGHGDMKMYDSNIASERYVCPECGLKLDFDTQTGKVAKIAGVGAVLMGALLVGAKLFFGGDSGSSGSA